MARRLERYGCNPVLAAGLIVILSGVSTVVGLASGPILGALIMYYLLKDGGQLRR